MAIHDEGFAVLLPEAQHWRDSTIMKIPNANLLHDLGGSERMGGRLWRLPPYSANTLHRHVESWEFYFLLDGTGRIRVGEKSVTVSRYGSVLVAPHMLRQVFNDTPTEALWLILAAPQEGAAAEEADPSEIYPEGQSALPPELRDRVWPPEPDSSQARWAAAERPVRQATSLQSHRTRDISFRAGYGLLAVLMVSVGLWFLLGAWGILPALTQGAVARADGDTDFLHVIHELGAALLGLGLGSGWCALNLLKSRPVHLVLAFVLTAIALVHGFDVRDAAPTGRFALLAWSTPAVVLVLSYFGHPARRAA